MISPLAHVDPSARLGKDVTVYPFAYIDADVEIGDGAVIMPYASVMKGTTLGKNVKVYQGAIVGADPQDFRWKGNPTRCSIGDNTVIREHVIINRGIRDTGGTIVGADCFVMANSHIGHDTCVHEHCVIGNGAILAGDTEIGKCTILSSGSIVHEGNKVGAWVLVKGGCRIGSNVPPYVIVAHNPVAYFGVNAVVMQKNGFTSDQIDDAAKCYRHIYQSGTSVFNALKRVEADVQDSELRKEILNFIRNNNLRLVATNLDL